MRGPPPAGRWLRHYASMLERYAAPRTVRERQQLTRTIHDAALYARTLSASHHHRPIL